MVIYIVGALRNPRVLEVDHALRAAGYEPFSDWYSAGKDADDFLRDYYKQRGMSIKQTLQSYAARHIFDFDLYHLNRAEAGVLVLPSGKSGHLEAGYLCGQKKPVYILFDEEPPRVEVMWQFATGGVHYSIDELIAALPRL